MSFGQTLREAREAKGYTQSELALKTNLIVQVVNGLENEDFRMIPAPVYGRGFVKLYCEATDLDPKPLQEEFMRLFNEHRDSPPKTMPSLSLPKKTTATPPETAAADVAQTSAPTAELFTEDKHAEAVGEEPLKRKNYGDLFGHSYTQEQPEKVSAVEKFRDTMSNVSSGVFSNAKHLPPNFGRIVTVAAAAIFMVVIISWGISALYEATTPVADEKESVTKTESPGAKPQKATASGKAAPRAKEASDIPLPKAGSLKSSGIDTPALYIN